MKKLSFWCLLTAISFFAASQTYYKSLVPVPYSVSATDGSFKINSGTKILFEPKQNLAFAAHWISEKIYEKSGVKLPVDSVSKDEMGFPSIRLSIRDSAVWCGEEGYHLVIGKEGINIVALKPAGIFYALETLYQCFPETVKMPEIKVPAVRIDDKPSFSWRGLNLDCGRHFMEKEFVKRYIDLLAMHKMNVLHWHLTEDQGWRIEIKKYPKLTSVGAWRKQSDGSIYGGFYTQEEIKEIVKYAAERHVTVVPEIEMPGHSLAALASYPYLSCSGGPFEVEKQWGVFKDIYCAGNDSVFTFLQDVLDEVMALFPSKYIHIGGDEAPKFRWEHCEKCQKRMKDENLKNEHELQSWFIGRINSYLNSKGRKLIGWDEILEGGSDKLSGVTVQSWRGFEGAKSAAESGNYAIVSPTSHCYFDYDVTSISLEKVYSFNPIPEGLAAEKAGRILGGEGNMWTEYTPQPLVDSKVFPRLCALSEVLWSPAARRNWDDFTKRMKTHYQRLKLAGVTYGFERSPISFDIQYNPDQKGFVCKLIPGQEGLEFNYSLIKGQVHEKLSKYENPVLATETGGIDVRIMQKDGLTLGTFVREFVIHKAIGKKLTIKTPYSPQYPAAGANTLVDGLKGTGHFRDKLWQGYNGTDVEIIIDLGQKETVHSVRCGFLQSTLSWIFYPTKVEVFLSTNGKKWKKAGETSGKISEKDTEMTTQNLSVEFKENNTRYIKLRAVSIGKCPSWHPGAGENSWIFMDEIEVQ